MIDSAHPLTIIMAAAVFVLVSCVWGMILLVWIIRREKRRREVEQRLGLGSGSGDGHDPAGTRVLRLWRDGEEASTQVAGADAPVSVSRRLRGIPEQLGLEMPVQSLLLGISGMLLLVGVIGYLLTGSLITTLSLVAVAVAALWIAAQQRRAARARLFENQFIDALHLVARSLRAGHPLQGAFQLVAIEMGRPVSTIFADVVQQQSLGLSMNDALERTAARHWSEDLKLFATSVGIQLRSGGNLADMMERLAAVIAERLRLARRIKVLNMQSQMSKRVLLILPVGMFAFLGLTQPQYVAPLLETQPGHIMLAYCIFSLAVGSWVMNRMADLRY